MTSAYPGGIDAFDNPGPTTQRNASGLEHSAQHTNVNDAVEAIEGELGTDPAGTYATVKARLDAADYNASLTSSYWKFKTGTSDTDPGAGQFTMNNAAKASATYLYLDDLTGGGTDVSNFMPLLAANDKVFIQDQNDASKRVRYSITGVAVDGTGYWKVPVVSESAAGGEISNNDDCLVLWTIGALGAASRLEVATWSQGPSIVASTGGYKWKARRAVSVSAVSASLGTAPTASDGFSVDVRKNGTTILSATMDFASGDLTKNGALSGSPTLADGDYLDVAVSSVTGTSMQRLTVQVEMV